MWCGTTSPACRGPAGPSPDWFRSRGPGRCRPLAGSAERSPAFEGSHASRPPCSPAWRGRPRLLGTSRADTRLQPWASSICPGGGPGLAKSGKSAAQSSSNNATESRTLKTMCRRRLTDICSPSTASPYLQHEAGLAKQRNGIRAGHSVRANTSRTSSRLVSGCRNANRPTVSPSHFVGGMNATWSSCSRCAQAS